MDFDRTTTAVAFVALVAVATGISLAMPMATSTVFMMVVPSVAAFGLVTLYLGVRHGEHRAGGR